MGSIKIAGKNVVTQSGSDEPTIASNVVFPAGNILQVVYGVCKDRKQVGTSVDYLIDIEFVTKGASSTFFAVASLAIGGYADSHGFYCGLSLSTGASPDHNDYMDRGSSADSNGPYDSYGGTLWMKDFGSMSDGSGSQYHLASYPLVARKETTHATGTTLSAALWVIGDSAAYINRSQDRVTHETAITTLMVYEMTGGTNIVDVTDGDDA